MKKFNPEKLKEIRGNRTIEEFYVFLKNNGIKAACTTLRNYEAGRTVPDADFLGSVCSLFDISSIDFFYQETMQASMSELVRTNI